MRGDKRGREREGEKGAMCQNGRKITLRHVVRPVDRPRHGVNTQSRSLCYAFNQKNTLRITGRVLRTNKILVANYRSSGPNGRRGPRDRWTAYHNKTQMGCGQTDERRPPRGLIRADNDFVWSEQHYADGPTGLVCGKDAISCAGGAPPLDGVYPFSICTRGLGPRCNMQVVLPFGTTWCSPLIVYTTQYHTQRAVTALCDRDVHGRREKEAIKGRGGLFGCSATMPTRAKECELDTPVLVGNATTE